MGKINKYKTILFDKYSSYYCATIIYHGEEYKLGFCVNTSGYLYLFTYSNVSDVIHIDIQKISTGLKLSGKLFCKKGQYRMTWYDEDIEDKNFIKDAKNIYRNYKKEILKMANIGRGI